MCQIIYKPAGFSVDHDLLKSSMFVNPDGFGFITLGGESLIVDKLHNGDNKPEDILPVMDALHDKEAFIHFRFKTRGKINTEACHPFKVYDANDRQVFVMHNGTFSGYGSEDKVDTLDFGEKVVGPLYDTFLKSGERRPLANNFFQDIIFKFMGSGDNKLVVVDSLQDYYIFGFNRGTVKKDGDTEWWVSNTYSFNRSHREPVSYGYSSSYGRWENGRWIPFSNNSTGGSPQPTNKGTSTASSGTTTNGTTKTTSENTSKCTEYPLGNDFGESSKSERKEKQSQKELFTLPERTIIPSYWKDVADLKSIDDLSALTFGDISNLVDIEPDNAKLLINDLLIELFDGEMDDLTELDNYQPSHGATNTAG